MLAELMLPMIVVTLYSSRPTMGGSLFCLLFDVMVVSVYLVSQRFSPQ